MSPQESKSRLKVITLLSVINRVHKKIHKPSDKSDKLTCSHNMACITHTHTHHVREYWYIGSMLARSDMEKNSTEEWTAIGL